MTGASTTSHAYPRPLLQRAGAVLLNGTWDFAFDPDAQFHAPDEVTWEAQIVVPYSPETPASGIANADYYRACWYRRHFRRPRLKQGERLLLHFGAVDFAAMVWVNGHFVGRHEGGYTPFWFDVTAALGDETGQVVVVRAEDDPHDLAKPRGKQDWQLRPHSIWYYRTTGIWQSVWLERVPSTWIGSVHWTPNLERWEIGLAVRMEGARRDDLQLRVVLQAGDRVLVEDTYSVAAGEVSRRIALSDPGVDDYRNELLWSPATPTLIQARLYLSTGHGDPLDMAYSYTALRSFGVQGDRVLLNGRPYQLRMVLDQGYWPESGLTAPSDDALRRDVELAKAMGFNGVRKHQKIEDPRYLFWADVLGLLVWEEMPSAYRFTHDSVERLTREWIEVIDRDLSHPCIIAWVPFNESWGVPNLPDSPAQRHYVEGLYHLTQTLDPTRPVIGNDGWESVATDIIGIHDYDSQPERIARRYATEEHLPRLFKRERPGGRLLFLGASPPVDHPLMLTEFGGIAFSPDPNKTWGYSRTITADEFARRYAELLDVVRPLSVFSGFCYTQFADTYQEANGLLFADRTPKFPLEDIAAATRGRRTARDPAAELQWRERLMSGVRQQHIAPEEEHRPGGSP